MPPMPPMPAMSMGMRNTMPCWPRMPYWMAPTRTTGIRDEQGTSTVINDAERFAVNLDVRHFKPDELTVNQLSMT